jgi:hypothetical protein
MRRIILLAVLMLLPMPVVYAHQPVAITDAHTSAKAGPIMVDGTISFAMRVNFTKANQVRGFRISLKEDELLNFEYLIIDRAPENRLATSKLPVVTITAPDGTKQVIKLNERSKFYEPYGRTNYLFLSRFSETAKAGIYEFSIKSKGKAGITVSTGSKEVRGEIYQPRQCPAAQATTSVEITNAQAATLIGMKKQVAISCIQSLGGITRVAQEDGRFFPLTKDYRTDRVDLFITKGVITQVSVG